MEVDKERETETKVAMKAKAGLLMWKTGGKQGTQDLRD